jgi:hypothetical protein
MKNLILIIIILSILTLSMISPFLPGKYDPLAMPLSLMIQVFGVVGLLLTVIGLLWWLMPERNYTFALLSLFVGKFVVLVLALVATFSSGKILGIVVILVGIYFFFKIKPMLKHLKSVDASRFNPAPFYLIILPVSILILQLFLIEPVTQWTRNRAIENAGEIISQLETFNATYGHYPATLQAMYSDYKTGVAGIEKYHYSPQGNAYNLSFEQPRFLFDNIGSREWVVFNPLDEHRVFSHTSWFLLVSPQELGRYQGWYAAGDAGHPRWKYFLFD